MSQPSNDRVEQIILNSLLLTNDGVGLFDPDDRLVFCNDALESIFGLPASEATNMTFTELCLNCYDTKKGVNVETDCFEHWIEVAQSKRRHCEYRTFETDTVEGKHFIVTEQIVNTNYLYMYVTDITEKKQNEQKLQLVSEELERLATTDFLTGIHNRRYFYETAKAQFSRSERESIDLSILMLDLDKFKLINDNYGHNAGDIVLQVFSKEISSLLRDYDVFARIGGEEFAVLLPATDSALAYLIAERIRKTVEAMQIKVGNETLKITASIGLAEKSGDIASFDDMMQLADKYLNQAKTKGRNQVLFNLIS